MLVNNSVYKLSLDFDFFFSKFSNLLYIKGFFGVLVVVLPSYYFFKFNNNNFLSFLFLDRFFFVSFISHFLYLARRLFFFNYVRLKIKGIGHRVRKVSNFLYKFFFFSASFFYFHVPFGLIFRLKKKRMLLLSNDLDLLKKVLAHILLLKKVTAYRKRGLLTFKHILLRKEGKRRL